MFRKRFRVLQPGLMLVVLLVGCGSNARFSTGTRVGSDKKPDRVRIEIDSPDPSQKKPIVTLSVATMVQQLYTTIFALPRMPEQIACTEELGPHYTLTFLQGEKTLTMVVAKHEGCWPISIAGERGDRQGTQDFWAQLDQAIYKATPVARPDALTIMHTTQAGRPSQTARITSVEQVQHLYNALLALPQDIPSRGCPPALTPEYQVTFHTADQAIHSVIDKNCGTISLEGEYKSRGGKYVMNDQFNHLFEQTLAGTTFALARPDKLTLELQDHNGTVSQSLIADADLMQRLFTKVFALRTGKASSDCPAEGDKIAGKGKFYTLSFTQWDLPVLLVEAYEGSCTSVSFGAGGGALQGDGEFWDLLHRAAKA